MIRQHSEYHEEGVEIIRLTHSPAPCSCFENIIRYILQNKSLKMANENIKDYRKVISFSSSILRENYGHNIGNKIIPECVTNL
jgi:hypothetical protein